MLYITKAELVELGACISGLKRFIKQTGGTDEPVKVSSLVGGLNTYRDLLWLAGKKLDKCEIVSLACSCALLNIEKIKPYTDKYQLIVDYLKNPTAAASDDAAYAAYSAAIAVDAYDAAYAAAYAAYAAAYSDASSDADAAYSAYADAVYAAYSAAYSDADAINNLLRELFDN